MRTAILALLLAGTATVAQAQSGELEGRVDRIEKELRAVQRKVFPGGSPGYFEPQIAPAAAPPADTGTPAGSAVGDLTQRVTALEAQVRTLTNQSEVNGHRLDVLEQGFARLQTSTDTRLERLEQPGAATTAGTAAGATGAAAGQGADAPAPFGPSGRKPLPPGTRPAASRGDTMADQAAADDAPPPAARDGADAAAAPARSGDAAEDAYMAGYALWSQKRYPEAEAALKKVVADYPGSNRASYAQNLLGRAYLDDGQLSSAAEAFLTSYKKFPRGKRAPDSLYYLGQTLTKLKKTAQACQAYDELRDVYGATLDATLKSRVAQGRADAKCGA